MTRRGREGVTMGFPWWSCGCGLEGGSGGVVPEPMGGDAGARPTFEPACGREHARLPAPIRQSWGSVTGSPARIGPHYRLRNLDVGCRWEMTPSLLLPLHLLLHLPLSFFLSPFVFRVLGCFTEWSLRMAWIPTAFIIPNTVLVSRFGSARFFGHWRFVSFGLLYSAFGRLVWAFLGAHEVHREFALVGPVISLGKMSVSLSPLETLQSCR